MMLVNAISGLGVFLFGMYMMEHALKDAAGRHFKRLIRNSTQTTVKALFTGIIATGMLQSSSVVSLLTLSFLSASLIPMQSAIGIIFGANIGTTITAWIVAVFGFKLNIASFALIISGMAALWMLLFTKNSRVAALMRIFIGFGLLFFGLGFLKESIEGLSLTFDLSLYRNSTLVIFFLIGVFVTAVIQSSSATTAIVLSALSSQMITFEQAAVIAVGSNIGTTITIVLGAIGSVPDKKRLALAHIGFNVLTAVAALLLLYPLIWLVDKIVGIEAFPIIGLALFHTFFNILGVLLLAAWIQKMVPPLNKLFISKEKPATKYIHQVDTKIADIALEAVRKEIYRLFRRVIKFSLLISNIKPPDLLSSKLSPQEILDQNKEVIPFEHEKFYMRSRDVEMATIDFINTLTQEKLLPSESAQIERLLRCVEELAYATKVFKDIYKNLNDFAEEDKDSVLAIYNRMRKNIIVMFDELLNLVYLEEDVSHIAVIQKNLVSVHDKLMKDITQAFRKYQINKHVVASMLNVNQAIYIAGVSLCQAMSLLLEDLDMTQEDKVQITTP
ncbi:MAG: Na/Pi symporter [Thiovulaceae bacterium]|nr:Na/Pi symporter [Sulfurimonadaceae bacterium]